MTQQKKHWCPPHIEQTLINLQHSVLEWEEQPMPSYFNQFGLRLRDFILLCKRLRLDTNQPTSVFQYRVLVEWVIIGLILRLLTLVLIR